MKYVKIKSAGEIKLEGITIDADYIDKHVAVLTLTDVVGNVLRIERDSSYGGINAQVLAPPEMAEYSKVTYEVFGEHRARLFTADEFAQKRELIGQLQRTETPYEEDVVRLPVDLVAKAAEEVPF